MSKRVIPAKEIYICDHCGREEESKWTAGDGWFHHNDQHGIPPHSFAICQLCVPAFRAFLNPNITKSLGIYGERVIQ